MPNRPKVVIIDDDVVTLKVLTAVLNDHGLQVRAASDSNTGMHLAETESPNLIILDVDLPNVNGLTLLSELRRNTHTQNVPILMLTGETTINSKGLAFDLGADAYFTKPFDHVLLRERITELLSKQP